MPYNENLTEGLAVLGQLAPANQSTSAKAIGPFNTKYFRRVIFDINLGVLGSSATIDFKVQAAATSGGTYTDVTGTAITQITAGATNFVRVEVRAETLGGASQGPFIKGVLTPGTAASQASVVAYGVAGYSPASDYNVVTPTQTINV
jgi:hypothetical protein